MLRRVLGLCGLLALACDAEGETKPVAKTDTKGNAGSAEAKSPSTTVGDQARPSDLCKAFDKDAVAAALGWAGMPRPSCA